VNHTRSISTIEDNKFEQIAIDVWPKDEEAEWIDINFLDHKGIFDSMFNRLSGHPMLEGRSKNDDRGIVIRNLIILYAAVI